MHAQASCRLKLGVKNKEKIMKKNRMECPLTQSEVISVNEQAKNQKLQNCSNELVHFTSVLCHQK